MGSSALSRGREDGVIVLGGLGPCTAVAKLRGSCAAAAWVVGAWLRGRCVLRIWEHMVGGSVLSCGREDGVIVLGGLGPRTAVVKLMWSSRYGGLGRRSLAMGVLHVADIGCKKRACAFLLPVNGTRTVGLAPFLCLAWFSGWVPTWFLRGPLRFAFFVFDLSGFGGFGFLFCCFLFTCMAEPPC